MQRRYIKKDEHPLDQWQQQSDHQPKAVKQRQRIEETIRLNQIDHRQHLPYVGQHVQVSQFHTLRRTLRAAREQDQSCLPGSTRVATEPRREELPDRRPGLFYTSYTGANVFQEHHLQPCILERLNIKSEPLKKDPRADDML